MKQTYRLTATCYLIEENENTADHNAYLAYFPLQSIVFRVNAYAGTLLKVLQKEPLIPQNALESKFLEHLVALGVANGSPEREPEHRHPERPTPIRTMLLTSDRCNLRCAYCYGAAGDSGDIMPMEIAEGALSFLVENALARKQPGIDISFHGGGEPTTNWRVLTGVVEKAEARCKETGLKLTSSICTNGVMAREKVAWIAAHIGTVVLSLDGPPDIHNAQRPMTDGRPSFEKVAATLDYLKAVKKPFVLRMTATALLENRLVDAYRYLVYRFRPRAISVEPLFVCGRCHTSDAEMPNEATFIDALSTMMRLSRTSGVPVQYSGGRLNYLNDRFCGAAGNNFFVTPRGEVTSCVEVSHAADPRSEMFVYGNYTAETGRFAFNLDRYRKLTTLNVHTFDECRDCFARWHCAGDCPAKARDLTEARNPFRCRINRAVLKQQLLQQLDRFSV